MRIVTLRLDEDQAALVWEALTNMIQANADSIAELGEDTAEAEGLADANRQMIDMIGELGID